MQILLVLYLSAVNLNVKEVGSISVIVEFSAGGGWWIHGPRQVGVRR